MTLRRQLAFAFAILASASIAHAQPKKPKIPPPPPAGAPAPVMADTSASGAAVETQELPPAAEVRRSLKFGAFLDGEAVLVNKESYGSRGFTLNDAAIYLEKDFGRGLSATIDLPFSSPDTTAGAATDNGIAFGAAKAQGYFNYLSGALSLRFGQYDTIYGYERNDSKDRFFADAGIIKTYLIPMTHTGVMVGYNIQALTLRAMIANPRDTNTMTNQNIEGGVQVRFDANQIYGAAGLLMGDDRPSQKSRQLIDAQFGFQTAQFTAGAYFADRKFPTVDKHATGFGAQGAFAVSPEVSAGARLEYVSDPATGVKSLFEIAAGPSYKWSPEVTLRGDVSILPVDFEPGDDVTYFGLRGSLVATF